MNIYLTKEKLSYDGGQDLYIGKINRKRLYCLNDVCRIFGIFFRETKKSLEEGGHYVCGIMIKRNKRCAENAFTDYDGLIEVLLMSRYDKSSTFKKWIDSIPDTSFKNCQKYTKKEAKQARPNANKNNKSSQTSINVVETGKQRVDSVETKTVEFPKQEGQQVESSKSRVTPSSFQKEKEKVKHSTNGKSDDDSNIKDIIVDFCKYENMKIDTLLFCLSHVESMTKSNYEQCLGPVASLRALTNLRWLRDLQIFIKAKYKDSPYFDQLPSTVAYKEKYKVS